MDLLETEGLLEWAPDHGEFHLPAPSIWPVVLAAGLTLAAFGITTFWVFSAFGLLLFVIATAGWVRGGATWLRRSAGGSF